MQEIEVHLSIHESLNNFKPSLEGCVFHVTSRVNWTYILNSGAIKPNTNGQFHSTFGSSRNSYFRNRGCVSLFDYRLPLDENVEFKRGKCSPFQLEALHSNGLTFAFLSHKSYSQLIPWSNWKIDGANQEMIVPEIEVGYLGAIPLAEIVHVTHLLIDEDPNSLGSRLKRARKTQK